MIVYNVQRRWFTMKNDAEAYRKAEKLPPAALYTLKIGTRDDLADLLNSLCGLGPVIGVNPDPPPEVIERNHITVIAPDCVPAFLLKDQSKRIVEDLLSGVVTEVR